MKPYDRDVARWYKLKDHPVQTALVNDKVRFKVVPAGRRSGKTERAKRFVVREAMQIPGPYFVATPTRDQTKRIYWGDLKRLALTSIYSKKPSESELIIPFPNGSTIHLIGLDKPQRMEGIPWVGGIIDEIADTKEGSWQENISPALDTVNPEMPDYRAWCWLIGVPAGLNHYYEMSEYAKKSGDPDWKCYEWHSADILPPDVIKAAKNRLSARQFRQEYEASFETALGKIYEDYAKANYTTETIKPHEQLMWFHDFNYTPLSSGIGVRRGEAFYILDEIILESAVARQSALEFVDKFRGHNNKSLVLYGDPAGRAGEKHGHSSDYTEMEQVLRQNGWKVERKVKNAAPAIKDRQNAVRAKICNANGHVSLFVNRSKCQYVDKGLATVQIKKGSTFLEDDSNKYQHITTAIGYCVDYEWPINKVESVFVEPLKSVNLWNQNARR
jgi:hypothetical protein